MARKRLAYWAIAFWLFAGILTGHASAALPRFEQPGWAALTPEQKAILAPLNKEWAEMDAFRRKQWIGIAQRFSAMSPAEQASIQRNMREWARLAPEERKIAREKFKSLRKIPPEERQLVKQQWDAYSALTEEEKERLRSKLPTPPKVKTPTKPPVSAKTAQARVATPAISQPRSPITPLKPPENPLIASGGHLPTPPQEEPAAPAAGE